MVVVGDTLNPLPVPTGVPPQEEVYQLIVCPVPPPPPFKVSVVLWPLQIVVCEAVADVGFAGTWLTVTVTWAQDEINGQALPTSYLP